MNLDWLKFKPLGEGWTLYCFGVATGVGTSVNWESGLATGVAVYVVLSLLKWILVGGEQ